MLDSDTLLMRRALELARRGAGLVSPNPMVGALLVNEGRVVGEGYHRYDLLKHAETYAIEAAGDQARGSTLYCNLEPCCHTGRTPPCADSIIEAGIARAVIAVKDPDRRVSGRGIEQLREAGIEVEVGILEDRAVQLNESYFKFITRGTPFIHAVIEYPADVTTRLFDWRPSNEFLQEASEYDAVLIGASGRLNTLVTKGAIRRERHRPLVIAASSTEPEHLNSLRRRILRKASVVTVDTDLAAVDVAGKVVRLDDAMPRTVARSQLGSVLPTLARMNVTSLLLLPGMVELSDPANFEELDKVTLVMSGSLNQGSLAIPWLYGDVEFDLEDAIAIEAAGFTEVSGYPSLRGVA